MANSNNTKAPTRFWIIGAAALAWNIIGMALYKSQVSMPPEVLATFPQAQQDFFTTTPAWVTGFYGLAVTAGVLGSALLLLRRALAYPVFIVSLVSIIVLDVYSFGIVNGVAIFGAGALVMPAIVLIVATALVWYARKASADGLLR